MALNVPLTAAVDAQSGAQELGTPATGARSALLVDCNDRDVEVRPIAARPAVHRVTHARKLPRKVAHAPRHKYVKPKPHKAHRKLVRKVVHRKAAAKWRPHRPAVRRPTIVYRPSPVHRVTYAAPLCGERTPAMSQMLGLPDVTQPVVAPLERPVTFTELGPIVGPNIVNPPAPVIDFPPIPGVPNGPGPLFPLGPGPAPVTGGGVPEPASWAMMLLGFGAVGWLTRRRRERPLGDFPEA